MSGFKGTKGKWARYTDSIPSIDKPVKHSVYVGTKRIALCYNLLDEEIKVDENEAPYNALLISKAPEMLEMLDELIKELSFHGYNNSTAIYKAKNLIKESTEL